METEREENLGDKIVDGLKHAIIELEEFRLQLALGKADAKDLYEDTKKSFALKVHELNHKMDNVKEVVKEKYTDAKSAFEALQVQLALGKAESKELFDEQYKKLSLAIHELEVKIKTNKTTSPYYDLMQTEIEKFKIKLQILDLKYKLKKIDAAEDFEANKESFLSKMETLKKKVSGKEESKFDHFREEIAQGYEHLKKAFSFS